MKNTKDKKWNLEIILKKLKIYTFTKKRRKKNNQADKTDRFIQNLWCDLGYLNNQLKEYKTKKHEITKEMNVNLKIINENKKIREIVTNIQNAIEKDKKEQNEFIAKYQKLLIVKWQSRKKNESLLKKNKEKMMNSLIWQHMIIIYWFGW